MGGEGKDGKKGGQEGERKEKGMNKKCKKRWKW